MESKTIFETKKLDKLFMIDPRAIIVPENFNCREDFGDLDELMQSIVTVGIQSPLRGRQEGDNFILTDGERRLRAIKKAIEQGNEIARVPFIVEPKGYTDAQRYLDQIICNSGKPFTAIEQSKVFQKLVTFGWTEQEISAKVGKSVSHVRNMLTLFNAPEQIQETIREGKISSTLAVEIIQENKDNAEEQVKIVEDAVKHAEVKGKKKVTKKVLKDLNNKLDKKESPTKTDKYREFNANDLKPNTNHNDTNKSDDNLSYVDGDSFVEMEYKNENEAVVETNEKKKKQCSLQKQSDAERLIDMYNLLVDNEVLNSKLDTLHFIISYLQDTDNYTEIDVINHFAS